MKSPYYTELQSAYATFKCWDFKGFRCYQIGIAFSGTKEAVFGVV